MNQIAKSKIAVLLSGLFAVAVPVLAQAAQPDSGTILDTVRSKDYAQPRKSEPGVDIQRESQPAMKSADGFKTKVTAFNITGATVFTDAQLQSKISSSVGQELTLAELEKVAAEISRFYRSKGYFVARAYLPAQEIKDGVVEIAVLEGRIGNISVKLEGDGRLSESAVEKVVAGSAKPGDVVKERRIERGLLLANDLAGVSVNSTMVPGSSVGTSDLVVEAKQTGTVNGGVDYDNFGNRFTGASRVGASFNINNPAKVGDQATLRVMTSGRGLRYGRVSYLLPVGVEGTKIGAAYSTMNYKLGDDFAVLNASGDARIASLYAIHPFVRSRNYNLYGQVGFDNKTMHDIANNLAYSDKRNKLWMMGISGDSRDGFRSGGMNSYSATFTSGMLDLATYMIAAGGIDTFPQTNGRYSKFNYSLARVQRLSDNYALYAAISGQAASKNLDSSEKLSLGGSSGIRAYPQGEASGDEGQLVNLELRRDMGESVYGNLQLIGFLDAGRTQLHKNTWTNWQGTNPNLANNYSLYGAGIGLNLSKAAGGERIGNYTVKVFFSTKIGTNLGRDANNRDSDNTDNKNTYWLQAIKWF